MSMRMNERMCGEFIFTIFMDNSAIKKSEVNLLVGAVHLKNKTQNAGPSPLSSE